MEKTLLIAVIILGMSACGTQRNLRTPLNTSDPNQREPTEQQGIITGAYTDYLPANAEDQALLDKATADIEGVAYLAHSVAKQVVAGMNYRFRGMACPKATCVPRYEVEIVVFEALPCHGGGLTVKSITRLNKTDRLTPEVTQ